MSKVLIVKAHPLTKENSSTMMLLDVFLKEYKKNNPHDTFEVVNVFDKELPSIDEQMLIALNAKEHELTLSQKEQLSIMEKYIDQFLDSDKVVIANPLWNYMVPSHLKQWFDTIVKAGKTFDYTKEGKVTYTNNKKILHLQSNGSKVFGKDLASKYIDEIFKFIGIDAVHHIAIDGKDIPGRQEEAIALGHKEAIFYAKEF